MIRIDGVGYLKWNEKENGSPYSVWPWSGFDKIGNPSILSGKPSVDISNGSSLTWLDLVFELDPRHTSSLTDSPTVEQAVFSGGQLHYEGSTELDATTSQLPIWLWHAFFLLSQRNYFGSVGYKLGGTSTITLTISTPFPVLDADICLGFIADEIKELVRYSKSILRKGRS
ncbi:MAG: hypothetical protein WCO52_04375 [bacterium]